jgi:hypothetical protein
MFTKSTHCSHTSTAQPCALHSVTEWLCTWESMDRMLRKTDCNVMCSGESETVPFRARTAYILVGLEYALRDNSSAALIITTDRYTLVY